MTLRNPNNDDLRDIIVLSIFYILVGIAAYFKNNPS
jgi:hypothetical protein